MIKYNWNLRLKNFAMGTQDRGGGREGKGHDRRTKRSITNDINPFEKKEVAPALTSSPLPPRLAPRKLDSSVLDAGALLISRQLARDQQRMLQRAQEGGIDAIVCFSTDFDRVGEISTLVKQYPGFLYAAYGIHPDSIRSNVKTGDKRLGDLRAMALTPECVALFAGLDFSRENSTHYAQEALLKDQLALAADIRLPVLMQQVSAGERLAEIVTEFRASWAAGAAAREKKA